MPKKPEVFLLSSFRPLRWCTDYWAATEYWVCKQFLQDCEMHGDVLRCDNHDEYDMFFYLVATNSREFPWEGFCQQNEWWIYFFITFSMFCYIYRKAESGSVSKWIPNVLAFREVLEGRFGLFRVLFIVNPSTQLYVTFPFLYINYSSNRLWNIFQWINWTWTEFRIIQAYLYLAPFT